MTDQFVAEIRIFPFNFAPAGWAMCQGQLIPISQNTALFSLLGTQYGGDGRSNFALPNLQGCFPLNAGTGAGLTQRVQGETGGSSTVTLLASEMGVHSHQVQTVDAAGSSPTPAGALFAQAHRQRFATNAYASAFAAGPSLSPVVTPSGGGQPHNNLPPYLVLNFCIALVGIFPPRS